MVKSTFLFRLIYLLSCLFVLPASAQQTQLDSLLSVLEKQPNQYTEDVLYLRYKIAKLYQQRNLKQALAFAEESLVMAKQVNAPGSLAYFYQIVGNLSSLMGDFKRGATYIDLATKAIENQTDTLSLARKSLILMMKGGWLPAFSSDEEKIRNGNRSLELYTLLGDEEGMAIVLSELSNAYKNRALYHSKGNAVSDSADFRKAREYIKKAEFYNRKSNNKEQLAYSLSMHALFEKQLGFLPSAYALNKMAIDIYAKEGMMLSAAFPLSEMANILYTRKKYDSSLYYINNAIEFCEKVGYEGNIEEFFDRKAEIYEAMHDYKNALLNNKLSRKARAEKYTAETTRSVAEIENSYENKLREEKIRTLNAQKESTEKQATQKTLLLSGIILFLIVAVVGLLTYLKQRQKMVSQLQVNTRLDKALARSLESQLLQAQLQALQGQMNPHFIYNALSSIQGLILSENKDNAINYLNDFTQLSRLTLENSRKERIKLSDEIKFLERYLDLECLRHQSKFDFKIEVDETLDPESETIPPMLVQPIIENAIKHGLAPKKSKGNIHISFQLQKNELDLICIVDDDGIGRKQAEFNKSILANKSLSTEMNETRLKLFNAQQKLKGRYHMDIEDKYDQHGLACGTRVIIYLALINEESELLKNDKGDYR